MTKLNEHMHMNMIDVNKYMHNNRNQHLLKTLGIGITFRSQIPTGKSPQSYRHKLIPDEDTLPHKSNMPSDRNWGISHQFT